MEEKTEYETKKKEIDEQMQAAMTLLDSLANTLERDEDLFKRMMKLNENLIAKNKNLESRLTRHIIHFTVLYVIYFALVVIIAFK